MMRRLIPSLMAAVAVLAPAGVSATPQPASQVPASMFSGRWYEIARIPNILQRDCQGSSSNFAGFNPAAGRFRLVQVCHHGSPTGPVQNFSASGRIVPGSNNARMTLAFYGGLVRQDYMVVESNPEWAIMGTTNGRYVWLMSRRPVMDAATRARAIARMGQLGYPVNRLQYPVQA
jgi:apolipoprotein D and lipocalin family protein